MLIKIIIGFIVFAIIMAIWEEVSTGNEIREREEQKRKDYDEAYYKLKNSDLCKNLLSQLPINLNCVPTVIYINADCISGGDYKDYEQTFITSFSIKYPLLRNDYEMTAFSDIINEKYDNAYNIMIYSTDEGDIDLIKMTSKTYKPVSW